jgi:hypothetical protein
MTAEETTLLEGERGSQWAAAIRPSKVPVAIEVRLAPTDDGSSISITLRDRWMAPRVFGMNGTYRRVFEETRQAIDRVLTGLDGAAAATFATPRFRSKNAGIAILEHANTAAGHATETAADKADDVIEGGHETKTPHAWKGVDHVRFESPTGCTRLDLEQTQAHLTVAAMVASQPGDMPEKLVRQVERFATKVESMLGVHPTETVRIPVSEAERPVFELLHQQALIRGIVPLRTLHVCRDCRFEQVTNPDYEHMAERARKLHSLTGAVGATVSVSSGANPFLLVGKLFELKKLDPDFVCPRCQGMLADESIITFCPGCGERRAEALLQECPECHYDFRSSVPPERLWADVETDDDPGENVETEAPHLDAGSIVIPPPPPRPD